jgi:hypothetical protein
MSNELDLSWMLPLGPGAEDDDDDLDEYEDDPEDDDEDFDDLDEDDEDDEDETDDEVDHFYDEDGKLVHDTFDDEDE